MRPTIPIQQRPLLVGQITGSAAVNVGHAHAIGLDYIVGREDPKAAPARQLSQHLHRLGGRYDSTRLPLVNVRPRGRICQFPEEWQKCSGQGPGLLADCVIFSCRRGRTDGAAKVDLP